MNEWVQIDSEMDYWIGEYIDGWMNDSIER